MAEEEQEGVGLPQKGLNMIIKDALPDMRIANETREVLNQCCVEFIKHISKEAQLISSKDQRKTIYHDHVQKALKNLGFPHEYVDAANSVLGECKIAAEKRLKRKNSRLDKCGIPEEQLWQMQQRLIEQARREEAEKQQAAFNQFGNFDHFAVYQNQLDLSSTSYSSLNPSLYNTQQQQLQSSSDNNNFLVPSIPIYSTTNTQQPNQQQQPTSTFPQNYENLNSSSEIITSSSSSSQQQIIQPSTSLFSSSMSMPFGLNPQQLIVQENLKQQNNKEEEHQNILPELTVARAAQMLLFGNNNNKKDDNKNEDDEEENYDI